MSPDEFVFEGRGQLEPLAVEVSFSPLSKLEGAKNAVRGTRVLLLEVQEGMQSGA